MSENIIEVKNLTKVYEEGEILAVDSIKFNIRKGEIFALLGPNGAGKTTTISMLSTLLEPTEGTAIVNSHNVQEESNMVRKSIGVVFQEPSLDTELTGRENLELHAVLYGMKKEERNEKISEVLELVDLQDRADNFVKNYSGGMKRRLEIARGLIQTPKILFLDEPTLGLDPQTRRKIWEKIKELNSGPLEMTILITTHYMEEADELADRICIMDHGKIIALDTSQNLKKKISGDIIDIEFEKVESNKKLEDLSEELRGLEGINKISLGTTDEEGQTMEQNFNIPKNMPNVNPEMVRRRIRETLSNPEKFIKALKKFPMTSQFFLNAPFERKKQVAEMFRENEKIDELPEIIKEEIQKLLSGKIKSTETKTKSGISISCEKGGKCLPEIIQIISKFDKLEIKEVHMHNPTLEDVFLFYTGKEIREETSNGTKNIKKFIQMRQLRKK
ncbi:MAG: ABC transporter, ATP-binding protein (modular protein) [Promethearchaeota archaeon]|nr:MAG: ABC transporter, ATP-binding protein (modular protein) [Candidatus Lokiarchaeota archaeon]